MKDADLTSTYAYQRRVMKLLEWGEPPRPWRLKCPSHVLWLDALDAAFPDARFVMTHRDPTDVILSVADLYADIVGTFTDPGSTAATSADSTSSTGRWACNGRCDSATTVRRTGSTTSTFAPCRPIRSAEVTGLYAWLGTPVTDEFEARMQQLVGSTPPRSESRARTPTRWSSASTSTRSGRYSRGMWTARGGGRRTS